MGYYEEKKEELERLLRIIQGGHLELETRVQSELHALRELEKDLASREKDLNELAEGVEQLAKERQIGFPWLAKAYSDLWALQDSKLEFHLKNKKHPAVRASEVVKEHSRLRRAAQKEAKIAQYLVEYYENIAPFLVDFKEEVALPTEEDRRLLAEYSEEELQDEVTHYLSKEEYRKLPTEVRNQMALDRYWRRHKSKWHIGRIYERFIGYLFEEQGFDVEYVGIFQGYKDLGRDLICEKGNRTVVAQCKYWAQFKTIYEKHIFQFFGTVFQYKDSNPKKNVKAIFYTTTTVSDLARRFAKELGIQLEENHEFDRSYPCIKCNVARQTGEKIYHLPFDQQYDTTKVEKTRGEFYCKTVKEAEGAGFRRAFRYRGGEGKTKK